MKILVVEDNQITAELLTEVLSSQHHNIDVVVDGEAAWNVLLSFNYDLIILDVMLPKLDGISLCRRLRSQGNYTPIILLTAHNNSTNKVTGLDAGADDYLAKPFDINELLARIRALMRRGGLTSRPILEWSFLRLDPSSCAVTWQEQPVHLTPKEYALLELFLRNQQRIFSCGALIENVWSFEEPPTEDTVRSHLKGLRMKLRLSGVPKDPIESIYGMGYRLRSKEKLEQFENFQLKISKVKTDSIQKIWQRGKEKTGQRITLLEEATTQLLRNELRRKLRVKAEQEAHKLVGTLGMFGSNRGSSLAHEIEILLQGQEFISQEQAQHLSELVAALRQEFEQINLGEIQEIPQNPVSEELQSVLRDSEAKVLIVDHDTEFLSTVAELLTPCNCRVYTLDNPLHFWDILAAEQPELIVLNVEYTEISGIELCQLLRNHPLWNSLPVLFLGNTTDAETIHQVFAIGADDYINLPIVGPELVTRILKSLERTRLLSSLGKSDVFTAVTNQSQNELQ
jgi:DNA-binding response OmpR family regulator/HPt (histidine-containing phosphotransfer) domain-containing protein